MSPAVRVTAVGIAVLLVAQTGGAAVGAAPAVTASADDAEVQAVVALDRSADALLDVADHVSDPSPFVALVAYSRFDDSDPLEHDVRRDLDAVVSRTPGIPLTRAAREVDSPVSTVRHHAGVLEDEGLIATAKIRGRNRLYPAEFEGDAELAALLADDAARSVLAAIERREPASVTEVSRAVDRSPSTVSYHQKRLVDAGVVDRERDGKQVLLSVTDRANQLLSGRDVPDGVPSR